MNVCLLKHLEEKQLILQKIFCHSSPFFTYGYNHFLSHDQDAIFSPYDQLVPKKYSKNI